jgi:hypothetical protein
MVSYLVLLFALLSRLLPPLMHVSPWSWATADGSLWNFTAVGGSLLFFGARRPRSQAAIAIVALMASDYMLTVYAYRYPFHITGYLVTWAWYAGVCLLGSSLLKRVSFLRVTGAVLVSATSFFVLSNFAVWMGHLYAHTFAGLGACYAAALPFYRNDLISTAVVAGVLFGVPALVAWLAEHRQAQQTAA